MRGEPGSHPSLGRAPGPGRRWLVGCLKSRLPMALSGADWPFMLLFLANFQQPGVLSQARVSPQLVHLPSGLEVQPFPVPTIHVVTFAFSFYSPRESGQKRINPQVRRHPSPKTKPEHIVNEETKTIPF